MNDLYCTKSGSFSNKLGTDSKIVSCAKYGTSDTKHPHQIL